MQILVRHPQHGDRHFSVEEVNAMLASGELHRQVLGWTRGMNDWAPLEQIPGVEGGPPPPPEWPPAPIAPALPAGTVDGPSGPGGWLLLFIASLIVCSPAASAAPLFEDIRVVSTFEMPRLIWFSLYDAAAVICLLLGVATGVFLATGARPARKVAQVYLLARLITMLLGMLALALCEQVYYGEIARELRILLVGQAVQLAIYCGIWSSYLHKSVRVRNTYGPGLFDSATPTAAG